MVSLRRSGFALVEVLLVVKLQLKSSLNSM